MKNPPRIAQPASCFAALLMLATLASVCRAQAPAWQHTLDAVAKDVHAGTAHLETSRQLLLRRIGDREPAIAARLQDSAKLPPASGYQIVPAVQPTPDAKRLMGSRATYSLRALSERSTAGVTAAQALAEKAGDNAYAPALLTGQFEKLREELENVDAHQRYHDNWQREIDSNPAPFARNNDTLALLRQRDNASPNDRARLQARIDERVTRLQPVEGLSIQTDAASRHRLELVVHTDIGEPEFLAALREAVEQHWNQAPAMLAAGLRIELSVMYSTPASLYPDGPPAAGAAIDLQDHMARFPGDALVLTTGASSTHAWTGRSVLLGPTPLSQRTLAHELGHLLGFNDAYVRGFEAGGDPPFGVVIIERRDLYSDLMGNSATGEVSETMVRELFELYASEPYVCPCDAP